MSTSDSCWTGEELIHYENIVAWFSRKDGSPIFVLQFDPEGKLSNFHPGRKVEFAEEDKLKLRKRLDEQRKSNRPPHLDKFIQTMFPKMPTEKSLVISESYLHCDDLSVPFEFINRYYHYFASYFLVFKKIVPESYAIHHEWSDETHTLLTELVKVNKLCWSLARLKKKISQTPADDPDITVVKDIVKLIETKFNDFFNSTDKYKRELFIQVIWMYQEWIDDGIRVTKNDRCYSVSNLKRELQCHNNQNYKIIHHSN
jgi:hypothetical protein